MTGKLSKKGRNPGVVDNWLENLELYRKNVAYDETCLFRAVSEQLLDCQVFHERIRKECIEYGRLNYKHFKHLIEFEEDWQKHLDLLEKHMVICGNLEINLISRKYHRDVLIFHANQQQVYDVTKRGLSCDPLMLCLMDEDHYDAVYKKEHIINAGFCQSIVYKILYEEVFNISNVDNIVNAMLYEKTHVINQLELEEKNNTEDGEGEESKIENLGNAVIAPFPFKVAKALDPTIYRNIEYDSWGEVRRELRLGDWYYGDDKLKLGTRCILNNKNAGEPRDCYIQEIMKDQDKCVVYITKLAEKRVVNYSDLAPESDAKPWPLPYRFSKNLVIGNTIQLPSIEKIKSMRKKNKEKRQSKSYSETSIVSNLTSSEERDTVSAYVGAPLHMQSANDNNNKVEVSTDTTGLTYTQSDGLVMPLTPEINHYPQRYQWEQVQWPTTQYIQSDSYYPNTPDAFVWPQTPTTPYTGINFDFKPMVASAPVTPNVVPYHDSNYPYFYNYYIDNYPQYPLTPTTPTQHFPQKPQETLERPPENTQSLPSSTNNEHVIQNAQNLGQPPQNHRQNPSFEMYSPMVQLPSGTPVIYTPVPSEMEVVVPTSPVPMYTPPVEMQYVGPQGYVYSPPQNLPTVPWYTSPHGFPYNSQGFIFPQGNLPK